MTRKLFIIVFMIITSFCTSLHSQNLIAKSSGSTPIVLNQASGSTIAFSFSSTSIDIGGNYFFTGGDWRLGAKISGAADQGFLSLLQGNDLTAYGVSGALTVQTVVDNFFGTNAFLYPSLSYTLIRTNTMLASLDPNSKLFADQKIISYGSLQISLEYIANNHIFFNLDRNGTFYLGFTAAYGHANNSDDLKNVQLNHTITIDTFGNSLSSSKTVKYGNYLSDYKTAVVLEAIWLMGFTSNKIGLGIFGHNEELGNRTSKFNKGFGIYFTKPASPSSILGGITITYDSDGIAKGGVQVGFVF